ncbi:hypothetical protein N7448_009649 [Penicillium atrosanguineum]|uniref:Uncharacterized protein n=1 Tax=Penicillium atrosanguineum TaxID=1132637 RepID=A0A9W9PZU2_9EURO|nr:Ubiquitin carboxyl-terminal hydrolase isozyme L3 [Penicillium atrosanguineum]KAJ5123552.1 hypothetical protein N7448_009649 [Penicillium atrosanguineum]KAJ5142181.1 hypothetical protein N7526_003176 [Penicillium atrosanguineum]KAJ5298775.1 Ubiquitin carboxyl-terminal hydrolase isozyme L3 [Penicillium atrosanguineum]KAJ5320960.1 hypothetical protein N7476_003962 [Penicillium atrosanguineum]
MPEAFLPFGAPSSKTVLFVATEYGTVFDAPVTIGNHKSLVDPGNKNTYVMQNSYTCISCTSNLATSEEDYLHSNKTYHKSKILQPTRSQIFGVG